ncbi:MAG: hypothetical protein AABZ53_04695 [Planctomycetota bacterium]
MSQDSKLTENREHYHKALAATSGATTDAVATKVASLSTGQDASEKAISCLERVVELQSLVIGVLAAATGGIVWMHFFPSK